ncbi:hypothetical protein BpHYR1_013081 [Brachionus plicatilis]|uniref:Uncharacterized protein n=1 Tax=Brachionus plicatilis TaxID=10195 RepID=A0A3M7PQ09_BRAPC|nr:hypothetical protein BpHYR1_013081 [Brachionus plicatilis]
MVHETNHFLDDHYYAVSNPKKNRHAPYYAPTKNSQRSYQVQANSQQHQNSQPLFPTNEHDNYITYSQCLSNSNPLYTNSHTVQQNQNQASLYQDHDMPNPKKVYTTNSRITRNQYMDYFGLQDYLDKLKPDNNLSATYSALLK